ncbi:MAG: redoxin domain-containing protein [Cyclonatronaceae bacterium]
MLQKGDTAPGFTLKNTDGQDVSLADYKGHKVIILFFPLAFSSVCTAELCNVRDELKQYEQANAQVLGISVDSFFALKEFKQSQALNFPLLSDFNKETSNAYGCLYDSFYGMQGVAKRAAFVVDEAGKLAYAEVLEKASDLPDFEAIKQELG